MSRTLRIAQHWVRTAALEDRIAVLSRKYPQVPPEKIREMAAVDPSGARGSFLEWVVRRTKEGNIRWPEDKNRVQRALGMYADLKKKPREMKRYEVNPDINKYTLHDLEGVYRQIYGQQESESSVPDAGRGHIKIYDKNDFQVFRIGGPGTDPEESVKDACKFANGTSWCTVDPDTSKIYLERGPLYVIFQDGKKIAQTDGGQIMNPEDRDISLPENPALWKILAEIGAIPMSAYAVEYAIEVVGGRWLEGEPYILRDPLSLDNYLKGIRPGEWPEAEPVILQSGSSRLVYDYTYYNLHRRWPEGEKVMLSSQSKTRSLDLAMYAKNVVKGRWPEAEKEILRGPYEHHYRYLVTHQ